MNKNIMKTKAIFKIYKPIKELIKDMIYSFYGMYL